jgi:hypothetical protein
LTGAPERAFTVSHDSQVARIPRNPPSRSQLAERFGPLTRSVGRDTSRFAHDSDARGPRSRRSRMSQRLLRIDVDQLSCRHEVPSDGFGIRLGQGAQFRANGRVQPPRIRIVGADRGRPRARLTRRLAPSRFLASCRAGRAAPDWPVALTTAPGIPPAPALRPIVPNTFATDRCALTLGAPTSRPR